MNKLNIPKNPEDNKYHLEGKINFQGLKIKIENWKGSPRSGVDENGKPWRSILTCPYGFIEKIIMQSDKDHLDVFVGDNENSSNVYVVEQINPKTKKFDEYKVILGCDSEPQAVELYLSNYDTDIHFNSIGAFSMEDFKERIGYGKKGTTTIDEKTFEKSFVPDLFIDLEKANVKTHSRTTKTGKMSLVKQHSANVGRKKKGAAQKNPWIKKYGHLKLTRFPDADIKPKQVTINVDKDVDKHAVLVWKDKKTGNLIHAYTKTYMDKKSEEKYKRVEKKLNADVLKELKEKTLKHLNGKNFKRAQASAVLYIISETGLRVGSHRLLEQTGNKGIVTASPKDFQVNGDTIVINYRGKSYQDNSGVVTNKELADFIKKLKNERGNEKFLFSIDHARVGYTLKKFLDNDNIKTKDLRTFVANQEAQNILSKHTIGKLPDKKGERKKLVKTKLKDVFEEVSKKLNNTATVAKNAYVNPKLVKNWFKVNKLNINEYKAEIDELCKAQSITMDLDELIEEHEKLVKVLKSGNEEQLKKEAEHQAKELEEYKMKKKNRKEEAADAFEKAKQLKKASDNELQKAMDLQKSFAEEHNSELCLVIDLEKANVKSHLRTSKSGKQFIVKEYQNAKLKKIPLHLHEKFSDPKKKAAAFSYLVLTGRESESDWTPEMWSNLGTKQKQAYMKVMKEPTFEKKIPTGAQATKTWLDQYGEATIYWSVEGSYHPATREEPEQEPEMIIYDIKLKDETKHIDTIDDKLYEEIFRKVEHLMSEDLPTVSKFTSEQKLKIKDGLAYGGQVGKFVEQNGNYVILRMKDGKDRSFHISDIKK